MNQIPVYTFTGFLDSGKTTFIQETLEDPRFNSGERTLLLVAEEGEAEYDLSKFRKNNIFQEIIDVDEVTTEELAAMQKKSRAERVVLEMNGMKLVGDFYNKMPEDWGIAQEVMFADSTTILQYNQNMRQLVYDKLSGCEMVVFNRVPIGTDTMPLHQLARAANRKVDIVYDFTDRSTVFDEREDPPPYNLDDDVITIKPQDYALFYADIMESPKKFDGKTVSFLAQVARLKKDRDGIFAPGRFVIQCCAADKSFMGIPCRYEKASELKTLSWIQLTAKVSVKFHTLYKGVGPILNAISVEPAEALPENEQDATF